MGTEKIENPQSESTQNKTPQSDPLQPFTLEILKLIKDIQQQHGLRHGDYQRYRGYCSRRISRLRKVLKIPQGDRRHFKKRDVTEAHIISPRSDERFLHIPLILAERCWAYAMQLRQESNTEPRKKFHLVQKMRKACVYAIQLDELCKQERCDARTKLEAQAYLAWIQGSLQFELQLWQQAVENLKKAQVIYEKIASTLPEEEQLPYKQRVEEISPSLRYCAYNIGDEKAVDLLELRTQGVLENFDALVSQNKEKTEDVLYEIKWFNLIIPVRIEKIRLFLVSIEGLKDSLIHAEDNQGKIKILENLFIDLRDIITLARDSSRAEKLTAKQTKEYQQLLAYLLSIRIERTSHRNALLILQTRKPQDCVRLLDINIQQTTELSQNEAIKDNEEVQKYYDLQVKAYKTLRFFYLAKSQVAQKRWKEAIVLFDYTFKSVQTINQGTFESEVKDLLQRVKEKSEIELAIAKANLVLDQKPEENLIQFPQSQKIYKSKKPLVERLDEFREETQLLLKNPNLVTLPPAMEPVPAKPFFFDLALNFVEFPDLSEKLDDGKSKQKQGAGISGFVKGLWGWGK
ncbi:signal recognition particle subunit SRP68 [Diorhabda carinulata]|uniref:signal recognition particle subunit SRP68 n=1 Tax=Diorhabda carinulata TaxID=1163345 RepID=UPI0025A278BD|nr:signal recognition particle subunit SRP68 [Diorhabda carinulata]